MKRYRDKKKTKNRKTKTNEENDQLDDDSYMINKKNKELQQENGR